MPLRVGLRPRDEALGAVPRRPPRLSRLALYVPGAALGIVILIAIGASAADARMVVAMAGRCLA